jgi:prophage maintenance system killer protein
MSRGNLPEPREILDVHDTIEREYDLKYTGAAVAAPRLKLRRLVSDVAEYDGTFLRAAALLRKLITSHYFEDGNKRTAWATTVLYLERCSAEPAERGTSVEQVLKRIRRYEVCEIAEWLATGKLDRDRLSP